MVEENLGLLRKIKIKCESHIHTYMHVGGSKVEELIIGQNG